MYLSLRARRKAAIEKIVPLPKLQTQLKNVDMRVVDSSFLIGKVTDELLAVLMLMGFSIPEETEEVLLSFEFRLSVACINEVRRDVFVYPPLEDL